MHISILETDASNFFIKAQSLENQSPEGRWRYFKFIDRNKVLGIFESEKVGVEVHEDFFKYFLGTFAPSLNKNFSIDQANTFSSFCTNLNEILKSKRSVYDLSVSKKWIWTDGEDLQVPAKLKSFID